MVRSKTRNSSQGLRQHRKLAQLHAHASEVAGNRLLSLGGKSAVEGNLMWAAWGWEKFLAAQRVGWEVSWALWSSALAPWTAKAGHRLFQASLRPIERKVRSNRTQLRSRR
jgi:hypothetical protein